MDLEDMAEVSWRNGNLKALKASLQSGVNLNFRDQWGVTALIFSLKSPKNVSAARLFLEQEDIDVDIFDSCHETALHWAARDDQTSECLAIILARTTQANPRDDYGCTALEVAVSSNAVRCVQVLLSDNRTDPNIKSNLNGGGGDSPLMLAVRNNNVDCVKLLLADPRVDLMIRDEYKKSEEEVAR